jgi:anti-sigma regulatory factor (Ser/Thr protein kinase)
MPRSATLSEATLPGAPTSVTGGFEHEAFFYDGASGFLRGTMPFIQAGLDADEAVLVVVGSDKIGELRSVLGADAHRVSFRDMAQVGRNPARIIPVWREFLDQQGGGAPVRGIGEPVWAARRSDELVECQRHEALLNVAFADGSPWRLLCPYDTAALSTGVIGEARRSHPFLTDGGPRQPSVDFLGERWTGGGGEMPPPPGDAECLQFGPATLGPVRRFVAEQARAVLDPDELSDLLLAVSEVAGNSIVHGGGHGSLQMWTSDRGVVCEICDRGWIREPLAGRTRPSVEGDRGRGLWMVNQLCDLVQIRSGPSGTTVRLHIHRRSTERRSA